MVDSGMVEFEVLEHGFECFRKEAGEKVAANTRLEDHSIMVW